MVIKYSEVGASIGRASLDGVLGEGVKGLGVVELVVGVGGRHDRMAGR